MPNYSKAILILDKYATQQFIRLAEATEDENKLFLIAHPDRGGFIHGPDGLTFPEGHEEAMFLWEKEKFYLRSPSLPWLNFITDFLHDVGYDHFALWILSDDNEFYEEGSYHPKEYGLFKEFAIDVKERVPDD